MNWKDLIRAYFHFTAKDRIALLIISAVLGLLILFPHFTKRLQSNELPVIDSAWTAALNKLDSQSISTRNPVYNNQPGSQFVESFLPSPFPFDPNSCTNQQWTELGLKEKTIQTIRRYLEKGGRFRKPEDLRKIYGLSAALYSRLEPFIQINVSKRNDKEISDSPAVKASNTVYRHSRSASKIDVNTADSIEWLGLPGIGPVLASRIIRFRERLGGYYSIYQIGEVYGLADSVFQSLRPFLLLDRKMLRTININTATIEELRHPYIPYKTGQAIIAYRKQHGNFSKAEDLKNIRTITDDVFQKILPYISF